MRYLIPRSKNLHIVNSSLLNRIDNIPKLVAIIFLCSTLLHDKLPFQERIIDLYFI